MGINSRAKGGRNERRIADLFTKWTGRKFAKTPASGGLQWKNSFSKGDIVCTKEGHYFPFCIEAKFYDKIDFSHLLTPGIKNVAILDFWKQAKRDADSCGKVPLLFMRYNGLPKDFYFVAMETDFMIELGMGHKGAYEFIRKGLVFNNKDLKTSLTIITSFDFFKLTYKTVKINAKTFIKGKKKPKERIKK